MKSKLKKFFIKTTNSFYSQTILCVIFFILFFFSLNYFYGKKMEFLNKNYYEAQKEISLELSSLPILKYKSAVMNSEMLYGVIIKSQIQSNTNFLQVENDFRKKILLIPKYSINQVKEKLTNFKFEEKSCQKFTIKNSTIFELDSLSGYDIRFYISYSGLENFDDYFFMKEKSLSPRVIIDPEEWNISYQTSDVAKRIDIYTQKKYIENFENVVKLCEKELYNFLKTSSSKIHNRHYSLYLKLLEMQKVILLKTESDSFFSQDIKIEEKEKQVIQFDLLAKELNYLLKEVNLLNEAARNDKTFFVIQETIGHKNIHFMLASNINKFSIFFIISFMSSAIFFIIILLLKKRHSKS